DSLRKVISWLISSCMALPHSWFNFLLQIQASITITTKTILIATTIVGRCHQQPKKSRITL
ncbi:hypothetical protein, partial [Klebsiella pneumoniae]